MDHQPANFLLPSDPRTFGFFVDGKIVEVGTTRTETGGNDFTLARYLSDGTLDTSFGNNGVVTTNFGFISTEVFSGDPTPVATDDQATGVGKFVP